MSTCLFSIMINLSSINRNEKYSHVVPKSGEAPYSRVARLPYALLASRGNIYWMCSSCIIILLKFWTHMETKQVVIMCLILQLVKRGCAIAMFLFVLCMYMAISEQDTLCSFLG